MTIGQSSIAVGLVFAAVYVITKLVRARKFEGTDTASLIGVFLAGCNIPAALFLIYYGLDPDPANVPTKLHSYEKFVSLAGLSLLATAGIAIYSTMSAIVPAATTIGADALDLHSATWGAGDRTVDVTEVVRSKIRHGKLTVLASNHLGSDPCQGVGKYLTVEYSHGGQRHSRIVPESQTLSIP